jgi:hypothetical protein
MMYYWQGYSPALALAPAEEPAKRFSGEADF